MSSNSLLSGIKVISLAINAPGPVAAARLARMGATVTKVEPPGGDPLKTAARAWYDSLCHGQTIVSLDLKESAGRAELDRLFSDANLLVVSFRPSALRRLGLDWESLHARHPHLCCAGIIGYPAPFEERTGHDLTYLADTGLLSPPAVPKSLFVDLAGAEKCVSLALALLLNFSRTRQAGCGFVSLHECAQELAAPLRAGLTAPGGVLSGDFPFYSIYPASDGWIAVAALEPHFAKRLCAELGLHEPSRAEFQKRFAEHSIRWWENWAGERDLPLAAIKL
jgi:crotonobetainyl-CoA:carnitine CoA-transferase CaiB-like acyl-CoA transferase